MIKITIGLIRYVHQSVFVSHNLKTKTWMDSLTDERNTWFNAVRLEDSHDYSSAALAFIDDAARCLSRGHFVRAAMSAASAASCLATLGDPDATTELYSAAASLYEHNADAGMGKSMRESLWSLLHAFEYFTLVSNHVSAERASKKYADLAKRVDRFESRNVFDALKVRRENVLLARDSLGSLPRPQKIAPNQDKIHRAANAFLQQVQSAIAEADGSPIGEQCLENDDENLSYETEDDFNERRIVS